MNTAQKFTDVMYSLQHNTYEDFQAKRHECFEACQKADAEIDRLRAALQMAHQTMSAVVEYVPADFVSTFLDVLEDNRKILQEQP